MSKATKLIISLLFFCLHNYTKAQNCNQFKELNNQIEKILLEEKLTENDFFTISGLLFEYEFTDTLKLLEGCLPTKKKIEQLFYSENDIKRAIAYRLIGVKNDTVFDDELITRLKSFENALLATWNVYALIKHKCSKASDDLFIFFVYPPKGFSANFLLDAYIKYDSLAVKNTSWKFINSKNRKEQIWAIQCLAHLGKDKKLQDLLLKFLENWEIKSKGWVISSMAIQKMGNLRPILKKYLANEDLKPIIIKALECSPTPQDNQFAKKIKKKDSE